VLNQLKQGDPLAAQKLWQRYVQKLVRLAHRKLRDAPRRVADEEDVVVAAFASFCRGVDEGRFSRLDDRDDLWHVLLVLTERRAVDQLRRQHAEKRGAGQVRGESGFEPCESEESPAAGLNQCADGEPTPAFAAEAAEQFRVLLTSCRTSTSDGLPLPRWRATATKKSRGSSELGCVPWNADCS